tara:strand:- start:194 stop:553 length:360 start_codon:yes stop_codon:yes gene_type:complete
MEELTLKQQIDKLVISKSLAVDNLDAVSQSLSELIKEEKQLSLPKISNDAFDKLLSIVEQCIIDTRIETGNNVDVYYSINDNEIDAEITLTSYFTGEVLSDIRSAIDEGDFLAIIEDGN